ncbi:Protein kinase superfamily protein [Zea mays]|uniref:non-specific serine/threonine protein kinase n=2 Tax=Zea mays TaxID=4577 RepID=A0A1D6LNC5_MAIZE|nr:Protein kinase superfamily protein [Zea mays]
MISHIPFFRRIHRWILPSCGDVHQPRPSSRRRGTHLASRSRRPRFRRPAAAPSKLRKVGSEGKLVLAVPKDVEEFRTMSAPYGHLSLFSYDELRKATGDFNPGQIVGEGGFGVVYRGLIDGAVRKGYPPTTEVAVKVLNPEGIQGDKEWLTEVSYLGQYRHPNLVELIGYCCEDNHRLLVYEFMAKGSLEHHLFRRACSLTWTTRVAVALHVARGLAFLHGSDRPIIYRDFKTSNILLDAEFNAKLSDFGLAKEGPMGDETHVSTRVMGTYGYAAPEYIATGHLTVMSDVYGFGVVLLEMLVGRRALEPSRAGARDGSLVDWARPILIRPNKLERILDRRMGKVDPEMGLERVARLAYDCLSHNPKVRPSMAKVVATLEAVLAAGDAAPPR